MKGGDGAELQLKQSKCEPVHFPVCANWGGKKESAKANGYLY